MRAAKRAKTTARALGIAVIVCACDKGGGATTVDAATATSTATPTSTSTSTSTSTATPTEARAARRGGPSGSLVRAARDLSLTPEKRATYDKLEAPLETDDGMDAELTSLRADLVDAIVAGKIDAAKLSPHYAAIDKIVQARREKQSAVLDGLYALLDPAQRALVVRAVRAKRIVRLDREKREGGDVAQAKRRIERITKDLGLDDAQQKKVAGIFARGPTHATIEALEGELRKRMDALLTAFEKDRFDGKAIDVPMGLGKTPHDALAWRVQLFAELVGVLRPEQRAKLADLERAAEPARGFGLPLGEQVDEEEDE